MPQGIPPPRGTIVWEFGLPFPGTVLKLRQRMCPKPPPPGGAPDWIVVTPLPAIEPLHAPKVPGGMLPAPTIVSGLYACSRSVQVSGVVSGAEVVLEGTTGAWWATCFQRPNTVPVENVDPLAGTLRIVSNVLGDIANTTYFGNQPLIKVAPGLITGHEITVVHEVCGVVQTSDPKTVQPLATAGIGDLVRRDVQRRRTPDRRAAGTAATTGRQRQPLRRSAAWRCTKPH